MAAGQLFVLVRVAFLYQHSSESAIGRQQPLDLACLEIEA